MLRFAHKFQVLSAIAAYDLRHLVRLALVFMFSCRHHFMLGNDHCHNARHSPKVPPVSTFAFGRARSPKRPRRRWFVSCLLLVNENGIVFGSCGVGFRFNIHMIPDSLPVTLQDSLLVRCPIGGLGGRKTRSAVRDRVVCCFAVRRPSLGSTPQNGTTQHSPRDREIVGGARDK